MTFPGFLPAFCVMAQTLLNSKTWKKIWDIRRKNKHIQYAVNICYPIRFCIIQGLSALQPQSDSSCLIPKTWAKLWTIVTAVSWAVWISIACKKKKNSDTELQYAVFSTKVNKFLIVNNHDFNEDHLATTRNWVKIRKNFTKLFIEGKR